MRCPLVTRSSPWAGSNIVNRSLETFVSLITRSSSNVVFVSAATREPLRGYIEPRWPPPARLHAFAQQHEGHAKRDCHGKAKQRERGNRHSSAARSPRPRPRPVESIAFRYVNILSFVYTMGPRFLQARLLRAQAPKSSVGAGMRLKKSIHCFDSP